MDNEAVVNTHFSYEAGWQVDEMANHHRGSQSIWFPNGDELPLEYDATKYKSHQEEDPALISSTAIVKVPISEEKSNKTLEYKN
eukprot:9497347-Ditylum_brightwellii.AAC.1